MSVGEPEPEMMRAVEMTEPLLPPGQPRYAMGLGTPAQLVELVARGVDMFDCVLPTRVARNGTAFTRKGTSASKPPPARPTFSPSTQAAMLRLPPLQSGLFAPPPQCRKILGLRMLSLHNTWLFLKVMAEVRTAIAAGTFADYRRQFAASFVPTRKVLLARSSKTR